MGHSEVHRDLEKGFKSTAINTKISQFQVIPRKSIMNFGNHNSTHANPFKTDGPSRKVQETFSKLGQLVLTIDCLRIAFKRKVEKN